jgi:hypothetical protein
MKHLIYNAATGETTMIDEPEIPEVEIEPSQPTERERLEALEAAMLELVLGGA